MSILCRCDFVRAVSCYNHAPIAEFEIGYKRGIGLFDRCGESRQAMRRRQIIGHARFSACRDRQRETQRPLSHQPHTSLTLIAAEEFKSRDIMKSWLRGNLRDPFV